MSRARCIVVALGMAFALPAPAATNPTLAGTWRSAPEETPLSTDFDVSVWGPNAKSVRTVQLIVRPTGEASLTVTRKVVDHRGRTVAGSTSIEEAQIAIGAAVATAAPRSTLEVAMKAAERRYPDDPSSKWPLEGVKVTIATFADDPAAIEVRFDTPEGRGSFWATLRRSRGAGPARPPSTPRTSSSTSS